MITRANVFLARLVWLSVCFFGFAANQLSAGNKDDLIVTAEPSFGSAGSVSPTVPGNATKQWFYSFCLPSGSSLNQTFPLKLQLNNSNGTTGESASISFNANGSLSGVTVVPNTFSTSDNGVAQAQNITLATGPLADGTHSVNVQISADPSSKVASSHNTIHIQVVVGSGCADSRPHCFLTSSEFDLLTDCAGAYVGGNSGGTFEIIAPRGRVQATNPGQFYYNMIWTNQGATQPITIELLANNLNSHGANAVHALVFDSTGFVNDASNFDMVNQDGTPCGPNGPCTINVPAGKTLWVTWHLQFSGIGGSSTGMSNVCPGNVTISASGSLKDSTGSIIGTCTASANGYLKK